MRVQSKRNFVRRRRTPADFADDEEASPFRLGGPNKSKAPITLARVPTLEKPDDGDAAPGPTDQTAGRRV